jgi:hypothetical protein
MNAQLKPIAPPVRQEYLGYQLVSDDDFDGWVSLNADALFGNYVLAGGSVYDALLALSVYAESEWRAQRDRRDDYAHTLRQFS